MSCMCFAIKISTWYQHVVKLCWSRVSQACGTETKSDSTTALIVCNNWGMPQHNVGCIVNRCATSIFQLEVSTFTTDRVQPWYCLISNFVCSWHQFEFRRSISHYCSASFLLRFCVDVLHGFSYISPTLYSDFCKLSSFIMSVFGLKVNCKAMQSVCRLTDFCLCWQMDLVIRYGSNVILPLKER